MTTYRFQFAAKPLRAMTRLVCMLLLASWFSGTALGMAQGSLGEEQSVLMCTQNGYEWVKIGADESSNTAPALQHCVFCLLPEVDTPLNTQSYSSAIFFDPAPPIVLRDDIPGFARLNLGRWHINRAPPL